MNKLLVVLVALACFLFAAHAWTDVGHILTAEVCSSFGYFCIPFQTKTSPYIVISPEIIFVIARRHMTPQHVKNLDAIAGTYHPFFKGNDVTKFPYLATFMDLIKADTHLFDSMHFIDFPYQVSGDFEAPNPESINAITAMKESVNNLIFSSTAPKTPAVWGKALSLMLLVHVLGDIHQPLHAVALFSKEFTPPIGDMGGNKWRLSYVSDAADKKHYTQMHLLFDCVGGIWPCAYMPPIITKDFETTIAKYADELMAEFPRESFDKELQFDFQTDVEFIDVMTRFATESFELAKTSYDTYPLDSTIDQTQIQWARSMLKKRIALAGYRMAMVLDRVDTTIRDAPDTSSIPPYWRAICILAIVAAVGALVAFVIAYRKYKDYKQLSPATPRSINGQQRDDAEYQSLISN